jgi:hypothetical protein
VKRSVLFVLGALVSAPTLFATWNYGYTHDFTTTGWSSGWSTVSGSVSQGLKGSGQIIETAGSYNVVNTALTLCVRVHTQPDAEFISDGRHEYDHTRSIRL